MSRARVGGARGRAAFGEIVRREEAWILRLLFALTGDRHEAEDVAQEAFTKAYLALGSFRGDGRLRSWLRIIATREAHSARRRIRERPHPSAEPPDRGRLDLTIAGFEARTDLLKLLDALPYAWREALVLRHVEGLSPAELATLWDTSVPAAKMRLSRARARLVELRAQAEEGP